MAPKEWQPPTLTLPLRVPFATPPAGARTYVAIMVRIGVDRCSCVRELHSLAPKDLDVETASIPNTDAEDEDKEDAAPERTPIQDEYG